MEKKKNLWAIPIDKSSRLYTNNGTLHLDKYSRASNGITKNQNIFITSDEEIKEGDWALDLCEDLGLKNQPFKVDKATLKFANQECEKIILTTDQDLINDGVQSIDDDFLEWFVKNPSCEYVEVELIDTFKKTNEVYVDAITSGNYYEIIKKYKIIIPKEEIINCEHCGGDGIYITADSERVECPMCEKGKIPKEEPKQETLEEAAEKYADFSNDYVPLAFGSKFNETTKRDFIEGAKWQAERMYSLDEIKYAMKNGYGIKYFSEHKFLKNLNNLKRNNYDSSRIFN